MSYKTPRDMTRPSWNLIYIVIIAFSGRLSLGLRSEGGNTCDGPFPLHLTPLIDHGQICTARFLSEVKDPDLVIPKSYAGFITADRKLGNHMFFWFFPSISDLKSPLVVWLNGGPTISSMLGLFWEHGPVRMTIPASPTANDTDPNKEIKYEKWPETWAEPFSMLYIDNPVGTGYSYTDSGDLGLKVTQDGYSSDLYSFIEQFYLLFPEYMERELYIGGQSYAGKYVPAFAYRIHQELEAGRSTLPLKGIYLGGPFFDPEHQSSPFADYFHAVGMISRTQVEKFKKQFAEFMKKTKDNNSSASEINSALFKDYGYPNVNNFMKHEYMPFKELSFLMESTKIRSLIHVGDNLPYNVVNRPLKDKFAPDIMVSTKPKLGVLMDNYKVLIYTGDYDMVISSVMVEAALMSTEWSHQAEYNVSERSPWRGEREDAAPYGFYTHIHNFCQVVIHGGGHNTPQDQPWSTREMMKQFIQHGCIGASRENGKDQDKERNKTEEVEISENRTETGEKSENGEALNIKGEEDTKNKESEYSEEKETNERKENITEEADNWRDEDQSTKNETEHETETGEKSEIGEALNIKGEEDTKNEESEYSEEKEINKKKENITEEAENWRDEDQSTKNETGHERNGAGNKTEETEDQRQMKEEIHEEQEDLMKEETLISINEKEEEKKSDDGEAQEQKNRTNQEEKMDGQESEAHIKKEDERVPSKRRRRRSLKL